MPILNGIVPSFEGTQGYQVGNFQDLILRQVNVEDLRLRNNDKNLFEPNIGQNRRMNNNPMFELELNRVRTCSKGMNNNPMLHLLFLHYWQNQFNNK